MSIFDELLTDTVSVLKRDGQVHTDIKAAVASGTISIDRSDILIEPRDLIQRKMSNGGEETYEVVDPGFHEKFHDIDAGYVAKVRKLGLPEAKTAIQSITVNVTGENARISTNSIDNSINSYVMHKNDVTDHLNSLREEVRHLGEDSSLDVVDAIEQQFASGKPSKVVVKTLLAGLPAASSIASIGSFLLACLA